MPSWEEAIKWSPPCTMCGAPMDKLDIYTGKDKWKANARKNQKHIAKFKCPKCGHTEVFK